MGEVLVGRAEELDRVVEGGAVTRIHGDPKGWNFFFGGWCGLVYCSVTFVSHKVIFLAIFDPTE